MKNRSPSLPRAKKNEAASRTSASARVMPPMAQAGRAVRSDSPALTTPPAWIPLVLIAVPLAAFWNSFGGAFVFDDEYRIVDNPLIRVWPPWELLAHSARPVVDVSLALTYALNGLNVTGFHVVNLAVHILAGLTLYGIVRRMLGSDRLRARFGPAAPWLAAASAAIWLAHPLQTQSVTYIIQRAESMMGLFYLLTLYCAIRGFASTHPGWWFVASIAACALGMGTKEVMVSAPIMVLLYDRLFVSSSFPEMARRRVHLYVGLAACWIIVLILLMSSRVSESTGATTGLTPFRYLTTQFGVIVHYLRLSVWPSPLVLDYTWKLPPTAWDVLPSAAVILALIGGTVLTVRRWPLITFWGAWFFLILAPTSSILPIGDLAFEHRMYLPLAAVVVLLVVGAHNAMGLGARYVGAPESVRRGVEIAL